jgi:hypothetical protein
MNRMRKSKQNPATCDCCEGVEALTPIAIFNRPGLDAIAYRVGTHGSFLETMQARLSSSKFPKLAALTTRDTRDTSIALLDAFATVGDVLTFYQERIANEGYLRTATERRSILELARLVGYRLRPGLSASVFLAYTLEPTQQSTIIEPGNKAQSLPGPNEKPQVFETAEKIIAYSGLSVMKPRLTQPQLFNSAGELANITLALKGASLNLRVNDTFLLDIRLLNPVVPQSAFYRVSDVTLEPELDRTIVQLVLAGPEPNFPGKPSLPVEAVAEVRAIVAKYLSLDAFGLSGPTADRIVARVDPLKTALNALETDEIKAPKLHAEAAKLLPYLSAEYAYAFQRGHTKIATWLSQFITDLTEFKKTAAFAVGATNLSLAGTSSRTSPGVPSFVSLIQPFKQHQSVQPNGEPQLRRRVQEIFSGRSEFVAQAFGVIQPQAAEVVAAVLTNANAVAETSTLAKTEGALELDRAQVFRLRAFMAGRNMPVVIREDRDAQGGTVFRTVSPPNLRNYIDALLAAGYDVDTGADLSVIALDAEYNQIKVGSNVVIEHLVTTGATNETKVSVHKITKADLRQLVFADVPLTCTVLTLDSPWLLAAESSGDGAGSITVLRSTTVFGQNEELALVETEAPVQLTFNPVIELDGVYSNLQPGRWIIISGERMVVDPTTQALIKTGVKVSELLMVASVEHQAKTLVNGVLAEVKGEKLHTFLHTAVPPAFGYVRNTVTIYGNVVRATHGETRTEVLGSGDGSKVLQTFELKQPPLTYLPAPVPSGTESTLEIRVNDVLWHEADNLFELEEHDRKYITKTDDDGKTTVIYGDGEHGVRLPTGVENIKAVYRQGLGKGGNVKAEQIKLPLTKPLGVKSVINPIPASGGVDKETRDQARLNAPIAVLALDRLVSVQDYADFARTYAGIAKANALRLSDGVREVVHLTVAGAGNIQIDPTSDLYRNLVAALERFGDTLQPLEVESFERVLLVVSAKVSVLPDYLWDVVKEKMRATLWDRLGFENRQLGQAVTLSEVLSLMQSVPGVDYVDFELLDSLTEEKLSDLNFGAKLTLKSRVNAELARLVNGDILPAQLVFLSQEASETLILEEVTT